jgi:hypothetical protein
MKISKMIGKMLLIAALALTSTTARKAMIPLLGFSILILG